MCWVTSPLGIERSHVACRNCWQAYVLSSPATSKMNSTPGLSRLSRHRSFADVLADVKRAHAALVEALEHVTDQQWGGGSAYTWDNGAPMTIASVFDYRYKGETHYAGHAAEIET